MILKQNVSLKEHCNYRIGGIADYFFEFHTLEELKQALIEYRQISSGLDSVFLLGSGTNILFSDEGYRGLVLKNSIKFLKLDREKVEVGAGNQMQDLVNFCSANCLSGMEWAGGLPGTVGGAIRGNAGAFGGEIKDNNLEVVTFSIKTNKEIVRTKEKCEFGYRQSIFKNDAKNEIILSASFKLNEGDGDTLKSLAQKNIDYRKNKHPLDLPNIGSTFKNIPVENVYEEVLKQFKPWVKNDPFPVLPAAKLIGSTDLVGKIIGGAQISTKHPNFIVNLGNAKAQDVLDLIEMIKTKIKEEFKIDLEEEVMII